MIFENFSLPLFTFIFKVTSVSLCHCVNVYSDWLREQFCNLSLNMLYILSLTHFFKYVEINDKPVRSETLIFEPLLTKINLNSERNKTIGFE